MQQIPFILLAFVLICACSTDGNKEIIPNSSPIFLDYSEAALDSAYNQKFWAPNRTEVLTQINGLTDLAKKDALPPQRIQYGDVEAASLDIYATDKQSSPIHFYVHGGAWRSGNGTEASIYNSRVFSQNEVVFVAPDYQLVTDAEGSLYPMVDQLRKALVWTFENAEQFGGDPNKIFISGHSAGAHLAGVLIATDWTKYNLPKDIIKGAFLTSGMYDLYPVSLSSRNEYVRFTEEMIKDLSPIHHIEQINMPVILAYGSEESPEFKRQSEAFAEALRKANKEVTLHILDGYNHFEIIIAYGNPFDLPPTLMLDQMNIKK
jgi:arylformamidase